jgi:biopolymer transport protein ExbD
MYGPPRDPEGEGQEGGILAEINVTPLTDVFLVLLIIFMVGASTAVDLERRNASITKGKLAERALQVQTPEGAGDQPLIAKDVVVSILPDGTMFVDTEEVDLDGLAVKLREARADGISPRVVVRGDEEAAYRMIMKVISTARRAGIEDVALSTRSGGGGR